jgi:hypothetical protein
VLGTDTLNTSEVICLVVIVKADRDGHLVTMQIVYIEFKVRLVNSAKQI